MICEPCREAGLIGEDLPLEDARNLHDDCKGGTHCNCQHKPTKKQADGSRAQRRE